MKNSILFMGVLFFLLMTTSSYAQEIKKLQKTEIKQMVIQSPKLEIVPKKERVIHGYIDPITGEEVTPNPREAPNKEIIIVYPPSSLQYPNSTWFNLDHEKIALDGEANAGHTLETKMLRWYYGNYRVVQDWTSCNVNEDGIWMTKIPWDGVNQGQRVKLKIMVRDIADRSVVKTVFMGRH